jgi:hypothetical protein
MPEMTVQQGEQGPSGAVAPSMSAPPSAPRERPLAWVRREVAQLAADILRTKAASAPVSTSVPVASTPTSAPGHPISTPAPIPTPAPPVSAPGPPPPTPTPTPTPPATPATGEPLAPGAVAPPVSVTAQQLQPLIIAALGTQSVAVDQPAPSEVVWYDHDGEVLVDLGRTLVRLLPGVVLVALMMETDQTGAGQVVVPLSVGTPQQPAGLLVATEGKPRGPVALVDRWGEAAVAATWSALLQAAHALALHSGIDTFGARLVPGAISTDGQTFSVLPQARHTIDAVAGR